MEAGLLDIVGGGKNAAAPVMSSMESMFRSMASLNKGQPRTNPLHNLPSEASAPVFQIVRGEPVRGRGSPVRASPPGWTSGSLSARSKTIPASPPLDVPPLSPRSLNRASPFEGMAQGFMSASSALSGEQGRLLDTIPQNSETPVQQPFFRPPRPDQSDVRSVHELRASAKGQERVYQSTIRQEWLDDEILQENAEWNIQRSDLKPLPVPPAIQLAYRPSSFEEAASMVNSGMSEKPAKTTLGLVLDGAVIAGFHPQFDFSTLAFGDRITHVDGEEVDVKSLPHVLRGSDVVGSVVTLTVRKSDGSSLVMQLRRWAIAGGKGKGNQPILATRSPPDISQDPTTPRPAMSTLLATPRARPPPASVQGMLNAFGEKEVDEINRTVAAMERSAADKALSKADLMTHFAPLSRDSSLDVEQVFKILDLDADGRISASDLAHVKFFFGAHEDKLETLWEFYQDSGGSSEFIGIVKKLVLYTTRSLFKLRSIVHGDGIAKPHLETGPSPAVVLKAVDDVCSFMAKDLLRKGLFREFLREANSMKLASSATIRTWLITMNCLEQTQDAEPSQGQGSEGRDEGATAPKSPSLASPLNKVATKVNSEPSCKSITLSTGQAITIPKSNKFQGLLVAACNELGAAAAKSSSFRAAVDRSQHMTLEWVLAEEVSGPNADAQLRDGPAPSSRQLLATDGVKSRLGLTLEKTTVKAVAPGSASQDRLKEGDIITHVHRRSVGPENILTDLALAATPGESILLTVRTKTTSKNPGEWPREIEQDILLPVPFKSHDILAADLLREAREEERKRREQTSARRDTLDTSAGPSVLGSAEGFFSSLTRINQNIVQGSRDMRQGTTKPEPEPKAGAADARALLEAAERGTPVGSMISLPTPSPSKATALRKLVRQIFNQYDSRQKGLLSMPQAAIVAALLHQKLLTGVERSSKALISAMQQKLRDHLDLQPAEETQPIIDFQTFYSFYKLEFDKLSLSIDPSSSVFTELERLQAVRVASNATPSTLPPDSISSLFSFHTPVQISPSPPPILGGGILAPPGASGKNGEHAFF